MSKFEKANKLASKWIDSMGGLSNISHIYGDDLSLLIYTLRDAGLLAPDLPAPMSVCENHTADWFDGDVYTHEGSGKIRVIVEDPRYPVECARELALSILAACDYAEKEQDNER